jgi:hypothetical protein
MHYQRQVRTGSPLGLRRLYRATDEERFWFYVRKTATCWLWTGAKSHGYGSLTLSAPTGERRRTVQAHRFAYELLVGPIPDELVLDHLAEVCGQKACVKVLADQSGPAHLEPVRQVVNVQRAWVGYVPGEVCKNGHPFDPANTYVSPKGIRQCRACGRDAMARYRQRQAARS